MSASIVRVRTMWGCALVVGIGPRRLLEKKLPAYRIKENSAEENLRSDPCADLQQASARRRMRRRDSE